MFIQRDLPLIVVLINWKSANVLWEEEESINDSAVKLVLVWSYTKFNPQWSFFLILKRLLRLVKKHRVITAVIWKQETFTSAEHGMF